MAKKTKYTVWIIIAVVVLGIFLLNSGIIKKTYKSSNLEALRTQCNNLEYASEIYRQCTTLTCNAYVEPPFYCLKTTTDNCAQGFWRKIEDCNTGNPPPPTNYRYYCRYGEYIYLQIGTGNPTHEFSCAEQLSGEPYCPDGKSKTYDHFLTGSEVYPMFQYLCEAAQCNCGSGYVCVGGECIQGVTPTTPPQCSISTPEYCTHIGKACVTYNNIAGKYACTDAYIYNGVTYCETENVKDCVALGYDSCMSNDCYEDQGTGYPTPYPTPTSRIYYCNTNNVCYTWTGTGNRPESCYDTLNECDASRNIGGGGGGSSPTPTPGSMTKDMCLAQASCRELGKCYVDSKGTGCEQQCFPYIQSWDSSKFDGVTQDSGCVTSKNASAFGIFIVLLFVGLIAIKMFKKN